MVVIDEKFNVKEEVPTARFWLMTKLRFGWDRQWENYLSELKANLIGLMEVKGEEPGDHGMAKKNAATKIMKKIETSAWRTIPSEFLRDMKIPRVLRR
jgi:hypothetical protein